MSCFQPSESPTASPAGSRMTIQHKSSEYRIIRTLSKQICITMVLLFEKTTLNMKNTAVLVTKSRFNIKYLLVRREIVTTRNGYFKWNTGDWHGTENNINNFSAPLCSTWWVFLFSVKLNPLYRKSGSLHGSWFLWGSLFGG